MNISIESACPDKPHALSKQQMEGKGILVEHCQSPLNFTLERSRPALSAHWLHLPLGQPIHLFQNPDDARSHESIISKSELAFVPAGQPTYWRAQVEDKPLLWMCIYLQPELITETAQSAGLNRDRIDLERCFIQPNPQVQQIAMMLLAELRSGGIAGELYIESLTQVLVIHLLRHYSSLQPIIADRYSLTHTRLQQSIDYIHAHLDSDLSMAQIAGSVNSSPTYFASSFKRATGISLHQYVIKQRVERAQLLLETTDLPIADVASQVGFSSQSHLTQHCKSFTGMTPRQLSNNRKNLINFRQNLKEIDRLQ
jgi:AraC family transcriptional regulator